MKDEEVCASCGEVRRLHSVHGECRFTARLDAPQVGLFNGWRDAYDQAVFRAAITGRRYYVRWEPNNRWWSLTETPRRLT